MQPIRLKLENFGPYESTEIDFSMYYAHTLFLISGKTGSGKTTIFDGMMYALYGKTSGGLREGKEMRSNFATSDKKTKVTFEFKQNQQTYLIEREPEQLVKKVSGEGYREQKNTARLTILNQDKKEMNQLTKISEVNTFIEELIGLNRDQFSQIVMLPQGEFRRFLNADSNSKEIILRKLFNTYFYRDIASFLKEKKKKEEAKFKDLDHSLVVEIKQLEWQEEWQSKISEEETIETILTTYDEQHKIYEDMALKQTKEFKQKQLELKKQQDLLTQQTRLLDYFTEKRKLDQLLVELKAKEDQINKAKEQVALLKKIDKIQPTVNVSHTLAEDYRNRESALKEQKNLQTHQTQELKTLEEKWLKINLEQGDISTKEKQLIKIEESIPLFKEEKRISEKIEEIKSSLQVAIEKQNGIVDKQDKLKNAKETLVNQIAQEPKLLSKKVDLREHLRNVADKLKIVEDYESKKVDLKELAKKLKTQKSELLKKEALLGQCEKDYRQLESDWARAQIAKLSLKLIEGEPCLVCGSTSHPNPAQDNQMTEADINSLELALEEIESNKNKIAQEITYTTSQISFNEDIFAKEELVIQATQSKIKAFFEEETHEVKWLDMIKKESTTSEAELLEIESRLTEIMKQKGEKTKLKEQETLLLIELDKQADELNELKTQLIEDETTKKNILKQLPTEWNSLDEMQSEQVRLTQTINSWQKEKQETEESLSSVKVNLARLDSSIQTNKSELKRLESQIDDNKQQINEFLEKNQLEKDELTYLLSQLEDLEGLQEMILAYDKETHTALNKEKELSDMIGESTEPVLEPIILKEEYLSNEVEESRNNLTRLELTIKKNNDIVLRIKKELEEKRETKKILIELTELADTLSGDGPNKLSMERFVLQMYLKRILQRGNEKLMTLTNGRYRFEVKEEQGSSKKATGLEINIFDDNVGAIRSVNTLSGGESFIAALSLALSLAEIIQEEAGGIKIDAMFIDEGFGSLDEDALEMAIRALEAIEGDGRIIGIISHVRELKERIPQQLQIISENGKSKVKPRLEFEEEVIR